VRIRNIWQKIFLWLSPALFVWAVWQHEVLFIYQKIGIPTGQVLDWTTWWNTPATIFTGMTFTHGIVYDSTLLIGFIAFAMWSLAIYFWNYNELQKLRKECANRKV
jgi:hypothetical protein